MRLRATSFEALTLGFAPLLKMKDTGSQAHVEPGPGLESQQAGDVVASTTAPGYTTISTQTRPCCLVWPGKTRLTYFQLANLLPPSQVMAHNQIPN